MPEPRSGEEEDQFVSRCMGDPEAVATFPDQAQRAAFCHATWDRTQEQVVAASACPGTEGGGSLTDVAGHPPRGAAGDAVPEQNKGASNAQACSGQAGSVQADPPARAVSTGERRASYRFRSKITAGADVPDGVPEGSIWGVRILEVGQSVNGEIYTEEAVRGAVPLFEGCPVFCYQLGTVLGDPQMDHLPEKIEELTGEFGLVGNEVGVLESIHYNEEAKALDGTFKVFHEGLRNKMLDARLLGNLGEGAKRDAFGLSINALGVKADDKQTVIRFTEAKTTEVVTTPAAGGRIRRLVASLTREDRVALTEALQVEPVGSQAAELREAKREDQVITVQATGDDGSTLALLEHIGKTAATGHSFSVVVDPGDKQYQREFGFDGDGSCRLQLNQTTKEGTVADKTLQEGVETRLREASQLEEAARLNAILDEARRRLDGAIDRWSEKDLTAEEKRAKVVEVAQEIQEALGGQVAAVAESLKENVGALAVKVKLLADQLSTAPDGEADKIIAALQRELSDYQTDEQQEEEPNMAKKDETAAATPPPQEDRFATLSAGLATTIQSNPILQKPEGKKLREALVELLGQEPAEDDKDREIRNLRETLRKQAIHNEFVRCAKDVDLQSSADAMALMDLSGVKVSDDYTKVEGIKEAVDAFVAERPWFVVQAPAAPGTPATPPEGAAPEGEGVQASATPPAATPPASPPEGAETQVGQKPAPRGQSEGEVPLRESANQGGGMTQEQAMAAYKRHAVKARRGDPRSAAVCDRLRSEFDF